VGRQIEFAKTYNPAAHDDFVREIHATTGALLSQLDRLSRAMMSFTKAADVLARLSRFMEGEGAAARDNLHELSVEQLARIVRGAASALDADVD
jgi:hypothetical protein